jgi:hypothetical protein
MKFRLLKATFLGLVLSVSSIANAGLINFTTLGNITNYTGNSDFEVTVFGGPETDVNLAPHVVSGQGLVNSSDPLVFGDAYPTEDIIRFSFLNSGIDSLTIAWNAAGSLVVPYGAIRAYGYDGSVLESRAWNNGGINTMAFDFTKDIASLELDSNAASGWRGSELSWWYAVTSINYVQGEEYAKVPEPSTLAIFALGMIGLASRRFKKQS